MNTLSKNQHDDENVQRIENVFEVKIGEWYWITTTEDEETIKRLTCVTEIGSNYVELTLAATKYTSTVRVHSNDINKELEPEPNYQEYIKNKVGEFKGESEKLMMKIREINEFIETKSGPNQNIEQSTRTLSIINSNNSIESYKIKLHECKEELPKLLEELKSNNQELVLWTQTQILAYSGLGKLVERSIGLINDKMFNISLYAGLEETAELIQDGKPAGPEVKLSIMQRKLYMDEECLINYEGGGMRFNSINRFDEWLLKPEIINKIFPTEKSMVAFQVRRSTYEKGDFSSFMSMFIEIGLRELDKLTFLYVRNGQKVYRINTEIDFDDKIFPNMSEFTYQEELMVKDHGQKIDDIITKREYDSLVEEVKQYEIKHKAWMKQNPDKNSFFSPYRDGPKKGPWGFSKNSYRKYDKNNVYYDDATETIQSQIKKFNRIALIIQGIFDRSEILNPHYKVELWNHDGFDKAINLIYDADRTLYGELPDFEVYKSKCNSSIKVGSITIGQQIAWLKKETEKYNNKHYDRERYSGNHYHQPYGNPGPGVFSMVKKFRPVVKECIYDWYRDRLSDQYRFEKSEKIRDTFTAKVDDVFHIDAYKIGDFKMFYNDPRTRANYLKWAPMLLLAEEYKLGNIIIHEDGDFEFKKNKNAS